MSVREASTSKSPAQTSNPPAVDGDHCIICLQSLSDRTILPSCGHDHTCFQCILAWISTCAANSRRCPLCNKEVGEFVIHGIRGEMDYERYWLPPVSDSASTPKAQLLPLRESGDAPRSIRFRARRQGEWGGRRRKRPDESDELERAVERRRFIYRHNLFAKHVASNRHTRYKPYPSPAHIASSQDLTSRVLKFVRRELRVWEGLDIEFLTHYILSLLRTMDLRSEGAIKLLAEFLDNEDAVIPRPEGVSSGQPRSSASSHSEHFAHELYTYLRSPFTDLSSWDRTVQYSKLYPPEAQPPEHGAQRVIH